MDNKLTSAEFEEVKKTVDRLIASPTEEEAEKCAAHLRSIKHEVHKAARFEVDEIISCAKQLRNAAIRLEEVTAALNDAKENQTFLKETLQHEYDKMQQDFVES